MLTGARPVFTNPLGLFLIHLNAKPLPLGRGFGLTPGDFLLAPRLDDQTIRHQFPEVFHLIFILGIEFGDAFHELVVAVGAGDHQDIGAAVLDGFILGLCHARRIPVS